MANLGPAPKAQFLTAAGQPLVGGKVYTYAAGTTTPLASYTDASGASANANPIILDGRGECSIWFAPSSSYKIKLTDSNDVEIYVVDNIVSSGYVSGGTIVSSSVVDSSITGGTISGATVTTSTIDNTIIGGSSPSSATFTTFAGSWASLPAGTRMIFAQTSAPTGWTKVTTDDNKALRVVSGAAGTGGSVPFTTAFSSQSITGTTDGHVLTEAQIPAHTHSYSFVNVTAGVALASGSNFIPVAATASTAATGGGEAHAHTFTGTSINLAVQYVDVIIAVKN